MSDVPDLLRRQAAWQKSRKELSWSDKIRMVEAMQGTLHQLKSLKNSFKSLAKNDNPVHGSR